MSKAKNQRKYRQLRKRGRIVVPVELSDVDAPAKLIELGYLPSGREDDRNALGRAVSDLIDAICLGVARKYQS